MSPSFTTLAINMVTALALGAAIGLERQWRQRLAGLRTNTLVALGAATFVAFGSVTGDTEGATRLAAQVVSGIGFLGAGIIFREGLNVHGLNTAATLWCSAGVGVLAGVGDPAPAAAAAALVIAVNLLLRPVVHWINHRSLNTRDGESCFLVSLVCRAEGEAHVRALLLQGLVTSDLRPQRLDSVNIEGSDRVEVLAVVAAEGRADSALEQVVGRLSLDPAVTAVRWTIGTGAELAGEEALFSRWARKSPENGLR